MAFPKDLSAITRRTPRMDRQMQRIISALQEKPMTDRELAAKLFVSRHTMSGYFRLMYKERMIHVSGYQKNEGNKPARIFSIGNKPDAVYEIKDRSRADTRKQRAKDRILHLLALPSTTRQVAARSILSANRTRDLIAELRKEGKVYIHGYYPPIGKGSYSPIYATGTKPDCVFVAPTGAERSQRLRLKRRQATGKNTAPSVFANLVKTAQQTYMMGEAA